MDGNNYSARYPQVNSFFANGWWPGCEEHFVDPGAALEWAVTTSHFSHKLQGAERELTEILAAAPDDAAIMPVLADFAVDHVALPEGNSWRAWVVQVLARVREALAEPATISPDQVNGLGLLARTGRFTDLETANAAATDVLRAHEERVRAWSQDAGGWWRLHLYADLARPVGVVLERTPGGAPAENTTPASGTVVLMRRLPDGQVYVATAYPELPLDVAVRERFADLCTVFGGYFGQDMDAVPWEMRGNLLACTGDPARSRMREQLAELLTLGDPQLGAAVHALGSYVAPVPLRPWVQRLWTGIDAYDWHHPDAAPP